MPSTICYEEGSEIDTSNVHGDPIFDADGFPIDLKDHIRDEDLTPITPSPKKRKATAKSVAKVRKASPPPPPPPPPGAPPLYGMPIERAMMACSDKPAPRVELCGRVGKKRFHITTLTLAGWGNTYKSDVEKIRKMIIENHMSRGQALAYKATLV